MAEKENRARYLEYEVRDRFDDSAYAVYAVSDGAVRLLKAGESAPAYHTLYLRYSDAYVDILDPVVTEKFISAMHEKYYERFATSFGRELRGFFTDEPQYYRYATPISAVTEKEYLAAYGENMKEGLLFTTGKIAKRHLSCSLYCSYVFFGISEFCFFGRLRLA